jgi:Ni/Co efflux regulator RcnB
MKKAVAAMAAAAAVAAIAAPAAAQPYDGRYERHDRYDRYDRDDRGRHGGWNINERQERLDRMIDRGVRNGSLSHREARRLREEFRDIARLEARYRHDGLSRWERADLDQRFDRLEARIRYERRDSRYGSRW